MFNQVIGTAMGINLQHDTPIFWNIFIINALNNLHLAIKFTVEPAKLDNISKALFNNFLGITISLYGNGYTETSILQGNKQSQSFYL